MDHSDYIRSARLAAGIEESVSPSLQPGGEFEQPTVGEASPPGIISTTGRIEAVFPSPREAYLLEPGVGETWPTPGAVTNCHSPFRAVRGCGCSVAVVRDHCDRKTCAAPYCGDKLRTKRARLIEERFEAGRVQRAVIYTVLTVPPRLRGKMTVKATWRKALGRLVGYMRKSLDLAYCVERSDPAGEDRATWHPHVNLLWVRNDGKGYISPEALEALKTRWKRILGEHPENPISVWTAFAKDFDKARREHWYSYMGRTWPEWEEGFKYHCRVKWLGKPAKKPERVHDPYCKKCGEEIAIVRTGSEEAARILCGRGYSVLLEEQRERVRALRRGAKIKGEFSVPAAAVLSGLVKLRW